MNYACYAVSRFVAKYGHFGQDVLVVFATVDPGHCFGPGRNRVSDHCSREYLLEAERFMNEWRDHAPFKLDGKKRDQDFGILKECVRRSFPPNQLVIVDIAVSASNIHEIAERIWRSAWLVGSLSWHKAAL